MQIKVWLWENSRLFDEGQSRSIKVNQGQSRSIKVDWELFWANLIQSGPISTDQAQFKVVNAFSAPRRRGLSDIRYNVILPQFVRKFQQIYAKLRIKYLYTHQFIS